jgi:hypothetical protein
VSAGPALLAVGILLVGTGCDVAAPGGSSIRITAPDAMADAELPLEVRWESDETPEGGFAVFVDRAPIAPGRDLRSLARRERDTACLQRDGCPDADWLNARRVYVSDGSAAIVDALGDNADGDVHRVSVVALDRDGRRSSDAGASVEVVVSRDG